VSGWVRSRNEPPRAPADLAPDDPSFFPTVVVPAGRCALCASMPDVGACPVCWGPAYLVHPGTFRGEPVGEHFYACQACRRAEFDAEQRDAS
jgi:hypothetical protein